MINSDMTRDLSADLATHTGDLQMAGLTFKWLEMSADIATQSGDGMINPEKLQDLSAVTNRRLKTGMINP